MKPKSVLFVLLFGVAVFQACKKDDPAEEPAGSINLAFEQHADGVPLVKDDLRYTNAAGNRFLVTEVKYFISDITLYQSGGTQIHIDDKAEVFYADNDIPSTLSVPLQDPIPAGSYDSVSFIFGIPEAKNKSQLFVNPPEALMGWPEVLGGGYHYMMINGKWVDTTGFLQPFNFHLGIGQLYHGSGFDTDSIYAFVQNDFRVSLPGSSFSVGDKEVLTLKITMNIEKWFGPPQVYDFNVWGGAMMQNQAAQAVARENGRFAFEIEITSQKDTHYGKTGN
jgi:hypothetical protein